MNRVFRALLIILCSEMGALLPYLPWTGFWEQNYFPSHLFRRFCRCCCILHSRGLVSGVGLLDIFLAFGLIRPRSDSPRVPSQ